MDHRPQLNELGFYTLAGAPQSPRDLIDEVPTARRSGSARAFISERFNIKEAATLSGAAGAVSQTLGIATAATNHNTRHPMVTASYATTMHRLTGGRFTLGLGRGIDAAVRRLRHPARSRPRRWRTSPACMRRLWQGEVIFGHDGPAGKFPVLHLDATFDEDIPLGLRRRSARTRSRSAGRAFDKVVLHTFFTDETVDALRARPCATRPSRPGAIPRRCASGRASRPSATTCPRTLRLKKTVGRLATYLQGYGDLLVRTNGWDPDVLARVPRRRRRAVVPRRDRRRWPTPRRSSTSPR